MDPNNPEHVERLRNAPDFQNALPHLKGMFEQLEEGRLYPQIDNNGEFQIGGEKGEGMTRDYMERTQRYAPLIAILLQYKENPISHQMLIEATKLFQRGEL